MAVFGGVTQAFVTNNAQSALSQLRAALERCNDVHLWLAAYASADLVALGFSSADATAILSALADAAALASIYNTGQPPGTYPQAASAYVYGNSQRSVIGPLS